MKDKLKVWKGLKKKTSGGLTKKDLMKNKRGKIVSKKQHRLAKKNNRLGKLGYKPTKGNFVLFHKRNKLTKKKKKK